VSEGGCELGAKLMRYRPLDTLTAFHMDKGSTSVAPVRYAVRQVLDQELRKEKVLQANMLRQARSTALVLDEDEDKENEAPTLSKVEQIKIQPVKVKRDFFGRVITDERPNSSGKGAQRAGSAVEAEGGRVWVSFNEGFSNAVRKPITLKELMDSF
jgi:chromosome transmission fidelity protein 18